MITFIRPAYRMDLTPVLWKEALAQRDERTGSDGGYIPSIATDRGSAGDEKPGLCEAGQSRVWTNGTKSRGLACRG